MKLGMIFLEGFFLFCLLSFLFSYPHFFFFSSSLSLNPLQLTGSVTNTLCTSAFLKTWFPWFVRLMFYERLAIYSIAGSDLHFYLNAPKKTPKKTGWNCSLLSWNIPCGTKFHCAYSYTTASYSGLLPVVYKIYPLHCQLLRRLTSHGKVILDQVLIYNTTRNKPLRRNALCSLYDTVKVKKHPTMFELQYKSTGPYVAACVSRCSVAALVATSVFKWESKLVGSFL